MSLARFCTTIAALVLISFAIQPGQAATAAGHASPHQTHVASNF